jgi:hypothetical protein
VSMSTGQEKTNTSRTRVDVRHGRRSLFCSLCFTHQLDGRGGFLLTSTREEVRYLYDCHDNDYVYEGRHSHA